MRRPTKSVHVPQGLAVSRRLVTDVRVLGYDQHSATADEVTTGTRPQADQVTERKHDVATRGRLDETPHKNHGGFAMQDHTNEARERRLRTIEALIELAGSSAGIESIAETALVEARAILGIAREAITIDRVREIEIVYPAGELPSWLRKAL